MYHQMSHRSLSLSLSLTLHANRSNLPATYLLLADDDDAYILYNYVHTVNIIF